MQIDWVQFFKSLIALSVAVFYIAGFVITIVFGTLYGLLLWIPASIGIMLLEASE